MRVARWEPVALVTGTPLYRDYLAGQGVARSFFPYAPEAGEEGRRLARLEAFPPARRRRLAERLARYQRQVGGGPAAEAAARRLSDPRAAVVTTGQQPGVLTGPLFTVYKAVTAVLVARRSEARLGRPVVPVFWIVSDDHDWEEAARVAVASPDGEIRRLRLASPLVGRALGDIPVPEGAAALVEEAVSLSGGGAGDVARFLLETARSSANVAEWFARLLARLFGDAGLVLLDPLAPGWAEESADLYAEAATAAPEVEAALARGAERLERSGCPVPLPPGGHAWLFHRGRGLRRGLLWRDGRFVSRRGDAAFGPEEVRRLAAEAPAELSPGAALRPVVRDRLLPTLAHVAGPGELAYLAQLGEVYRLFGLEMPVVYPRLSLTLVAPEDTAALAGLGLGLSDLFAGEGALDRALGGDALDAAFARARRATAEEHARLVADLEAAGVEVADLAAGNLGRMLAQLDYLEEKARQRLRRRHREAVGAWTRLRNRLLPDGQPQEKVLNVVPWLCRVGWGLAAELLSARLTGEHQAVVWEEGKGGDRRGEAPAILPEEGRRDGLAARRALREAGER